MKRARVLIAGAGVAGLDTLLALHALAGDRVDVTIVAPELKFVNRSLAVEQPFKRRRARGLGSVSSGVVHHADRPTLIVRRPVADA